MYTYNLMERDVEKDLPDWWPSTSVIPDYDSNQKYNHYFQIVQVTLFRPMRCKLISQIEAFKKAYKGTNSL